MADAASAVLSALADPSLWEIGEEAIVFDEHTETNPQTGQPEVFDRPRLDRLAANSNARDTIGQPCPITLGHTIDGAPETAQPPIVGYWRYFRVDWDARLGRWVIRSRPYVRKDRAAEAAQYPRVSVERWPGADFFDPIAILRRTPRLDLGQWTYEKSGRKVRYSWEEHYSMPEPTPAPAPSPAPAGAGGAPASGADEYGRACGHIQRYMAEHFPRLGEMHSKYAAGAAAAPPPAAGGPPDPTKPPVAPAAAGEVARMQADEWATKYARLEEQIATERGARLRAEAERMVLQLESEHVHIPDRAKAVQKLAAIAGDPERYAAFEEMRTHWAKKLPGPAGPAGGGFVQTARITEGGAKQAMSKEEMGVARRKAEKYARERNVSLADAYEAVMAENGAAAPS